MQGSPEFFERRAHARAEGLAWLKANPELVKNGFRRCSSCGHVGPERDDFVPDVRCRGGIRNQCHTCHSRVGREVRERHAPEYKERFRVWYANNRDKFRAIKRESNKKHAVQIALKKRTRRLAKMGLTPEQYDAMEKAQGGLCRICGGPPTGRWKRLHIDHDHKTGRVRGLLCVGCNRALGYLNDDPKRARSAAGYLEAAAVQPTDVLVDPLGCGDTQVGLESNP